MVAYVAVTVVVGTATVASEFLAKPLDNSLALCG